MQVKLDLIFSIKNFACELPGELPNTYNLGSYEIRLFQEILRTGWGHGRVPSVPSTKAHLVLELKRYIKRDIRVFRPCQILLDSFTVCQIFCPKLFVETNFCL